MAEIQLGLFDSPTFAEGGERLYRLARCAACGHEIGDTTPPEYTTLTESWMHVRRIDDDHHPRPERAAEETRR